MKKFIKLICLALSLMLVFAFAGCDLGGLARYKTTAKAGLETYAEEKGECNYWESDWAAIQNIVADGKKEIDAAADKSAVKFALDTAKEEIDMISQIIQVETEDMIDCTMFRYNSSSSWIGNPIALKYMDENAVFECTVDIGYIVLLGDPTQYVKNTHLKPYAGLCWMPENGMKAERAFVDIILKNDGNIIGYAVIEIYPNNPLGSTFLARTLKSAFFPKVDGKFQNVAENQVKTIIEKIKGENTL